MVYEIFRYPLTLTRKDSEFYDEVKCDRDVAQALARALCDAYSSEWWFYIKEKPAIEPVLRNWENAGKHMVDTSEPEPVGDVLYDGLRSMMQVV